MNIRIEKSGDTQIILPTGDLDMHESPKLRATLLSEIAKKPSGLIVDFSEVNFIDSSGVATLVEAMRAIKDVKSNLVLCQMNQKILDVFQLARLDKIFNIVQTRAEALKNALGE